MSGFQVFSPSVLRECFEVFCALVWDQRMRNEPLSVLVMDVRREDE